MRFCAVQDASHQICDEVQSPQQLLYNLYNAVALTEIKGYTMIQFSYMILRLYNEGIIPLHVLYSLLPIYLISSVTQAATSARRCRR